MFDEGLGVGSLRMWAKNDSPEMYEEIRNTECLKAIRESIQMPDTLGDEDLDKALGNLNVQPADVANVVHQMFRNEFVCISSQGKGRYYKFNRHRWELMDGNVLLRKRLTHDVYRAYMNHLKRIVEGASQGNAEDIAVNNSWLKDNKKIQRLVSCLKGTQFKNNVMDECKELFYDWTESTDGRKHKPFVQKLDSDPNLLGFDNGVFDFGKMEFRDGRPEDHISMSTNIDYKSDLSWENEEVEEVMTFLSQVLPDEDECEYVCVLLASFLNGNNRHEEFHIWTGSGGNGKSKLIELYQKVIGDYGCNLPISLLTSKRKSSGEAQPEVARTKGKRFAILQEPDTYTTINVGLMKELTGGDNIISRALYENPVEFKPQFKMILTCNKLPKLPYDDEGTWRRVRCVEFKSRFVNQEDLDTTDPYCQVKDPTLAEKFDNWKEAFMWILIEKYRVWMKDGLKAPKSVVNFTKQYREQSDAFADFRDEYIIADKKCNEPLIIKDVWNAYNEWHTSNGEGKRGSKKELQIYLEKKLGQMYGVGQIGWKGYRLKNSFEDEVIDNGLD